MFFNWKELRVEDYAANRKGGAAGAITFGGATQTGGLFGSTPAASTSGFSFGTTQSKPLFGTTGTTSKHWLLSVYVLQGFSRGFELQLKQKLAKIVISDEIKIRSELIMFFSVLERNKNYFSAPEMKHKEIFIFRN